MIACMDYAIIVINDKYKLKIYLPVILAVIIGIIVSLAVQGFISFVSFF